jgi:hypothetical protein
MHKYLRILLVIPLGILWLPTQAHAYLDPGTGSLVFQSLVAVVAAAGAAISLFWGRLRRLFGKGRKANALADQEDDEREDA